MGLLDKWNKNKFSVYDSEEKTVLKLIKVLTNWLESLIIEVDNKTDLYGDHKGSWQGLNRPTLSEEGMRATVEQLHDVTIPNINSQLADNVIQIQKLKEKLINVKDFGAKGDGVTDDTNAIQNAVNAISGGVIFFPRGTYKVSNKITFGILHKFRGEGRDVSIITNSNTALYTFECLTQIQSERYDADACIEFSDITINAKFGIRLNQSGDYSTVFDKQGHIKGANFERLKLQGNYSNVLDTNMRTNVEPTQSELLGYGVGIYMAKVFNFGVRDCQIQKYGVGVFCDGCDISTIENSRISYNAQNIRLKVMDSYGSQVKIVGNDLLQNERNGCIYLDGVKYTSIIDNYFENYSPSAVQIKSVGDRETVIDRNRFDSTKQADVPLLDMAPSKPVIFINNRYNVSDINPPITLRSTSLATMGVGVYGYPLAYWKNNSKDMPTPDAPAVFTKDLDPKIFKHDNFSYIGGTGSLQFPWYKNASGRYVFKTTNGLIETKLKSDKCTKYYFVEIIGKFISEDGYVAIDADGVRVSATWMGFPSTGALTRKLIPITLASDSAAEFYIQLVQKNCEYESVRIIPKDTENDLI